MKTEKQYVSVDRQFYMKLNKFYLRYYPPGIVFEYQTQKKTKQKILDLFDIEQETDVGALAGRIARDEPLITPGTLPQLEALLRKLRERTSRRDGGRDAASSFAVDHTLCGGHLLPIANVSIDKYGDICATGSYDRTCKIWNTRTGAEISTLVGHENAVYSVSLHAVAGRVLTGSFDKTARIWALDDSGECLCTMSGHSAEIVAADVCWPRQTVATSSMDQTTRLFSAATGTTVPVTNIMPYKYKLTSKPITLNILFFHYATHKLIFSGQSLATLDGHTGEVVANQFDKDGTTVITGSFDNTVKLWDTRTAKCIATLFGHTAELTTCRYDFSCNTIASSSLDNTAKLWDARRTDSCHHTITGHTDEVLDVCFDLVGRRLATASSDCSACIWDVHSGDLIAAMIGHTEEVSKVFWEPAGHHLLTASQDNSSMLWDTDTGECLQQLKSHTNHVFSAEISYLGDVILTASKDNTCCVWRQSKKT